MWPRGRPQSQQNLGSPNYGVGFNQYPQGAFRLEPPQQHYNNRQRRDRARPRFQYPYYSDDSISFNYSTNARGGALNARGVGRGSGLLNTTSRHVYNPKSQTSTKRQNESERSGSSSGQRDDNRSNKSGKNRNEVDRNSFHLRDNRNENRVKRNHHDYPTTYFCPNCRENYTIRYTQTKYIGKVPLILHCSHTMCQECIYQCLKNNKVNCPLCLADSTVTQEQTPVCQTDMQTIFLPNFYLLGIMSYYKPTAAHLRNLENITFISTTGLKKMHSLLPEPSERCCFTTCSKEATMFCPSCEGIYCSDCCTVVHKSTKKLMSHEPVPRRKQKFSLMLENCGEHPTMQVEFFCKTCDLTACCYCVLDKHTDHERVPLYHLNPVEIEEFKRQKQIAGKVLKEVLSTQKKATRMANFNTGSVKKEVCQYFADYHAKLESLEKKLCDELENFKSSNRGLDSIQSSLISSAEQLKQLVAFNEDKIGDKKLNLRGALEKLRDVENIPRFLLNEEGMSEPVRFVHNNAVIEALDDDFIIEKCEESEYRLVTEKELPEDYVKDKDESDSEVEETMSAIFNKSIQDCEQGSSKTNDLEAVVSASAESSVQSKRIPRFVKKKEYAKKKFDMEIVEVQHINSMDSFFLQFKKDQSKLGQLNKDIENFVKMGGTQTVQEPQLNDLYLALYVNESHGHKEQKWCRARLTEINKGENGPVYEMFFIDYGKTQIVDVNRIRDIPALLIQKKPFVIECMLHNPMGVNWNKKAHLSLAKILNGKDVYMLEKCQNHGIYEVDLMIASSDGGITSVTDILVHAHNALDPLNDDSASMDGSFSTIKDGFCPLLKVYPNSKSFTKNQKEKVVLANVVDPHNIFIHLVQFRENFKSMNHTIKKACKSARSGGCIPIEGSYVLVEYKDPIRSNFHRAFIKSVDLNADKVHVLLVDWGLNVVVSSRNIRPLQESFTKLESQAVLVKLAHIAPYNKQPTWSPYAANFLQAYLRNQDILKIVVQETEPEVEVALFDISGNVDICLNAMMVENNLADSIGPISTKLEWPQYEVTNPEFSEEDGLMSSLLKKVDEEAGDSEDEDLTDVKKRQVDVVKLDAPDLIWVKFLEFRERESSMFKDLQIHYSQEQKRKPAWQKGEQCVTEVGHEYARGKILEVLGNEYKIYLLDKVKEITAPIDKIYVYDKYFAKYPQAVIKSHLANIRPAGDTGKWSSSSIEALQEIFSKHTRIYANKAPESNVELSKKSLPLDMWYGLVIRGGPLDPDRIKYVSINNSLVKLGFAYKVPRPVASKPSTSKTGTASETASPVRTATTGEDLLKSLINANESREPSEESRLDQVDQDLSVETELVAEQGNETDKVPEIPKDDESKQKSTGAIKKTVASEILPKEVAKNDRTADYKVKSQQIKGLVQEIDKQDASDDDSPKNWSAIVDKELRELDPGSSLQEIENSEDTYIPPKYESETSPYRKCEVVIDDWLPAFRLTKKELQARVTCVETGGHLYLHEEAMDDVYYKMEENIKEYFESNPPEITDHQWGPGQLCTIKFTDGNWYRGKILKVKSPEVISVFMIDFGSDHDLSPDSLFREVLYTDVGAFATKVKLDKVYSRSGSWLTSDYDRFHELVSDWCRIVVKGPVDVELPLVEVYNQDGVFVNQRLVEICPNLSRCSNFPVQGADEEDEPVVIESIESEGSIADEILMDNLEREPGVKRTRLKELIIMEGSLEKLEYKMRPLPQELLEGKKILMEIGGFVHFDKLALRLPEDDVSEDMYNLIIELQDIVDSLPNLTEFTVGMPCIAPFSEDDVCYRARITSTKMVDLGFVDVIFVDYGNSESVPTKNIKMILPEHLVLPQNSWEVTLNVGFNDDKAKEANVISVMQLMNSLDRKKKWVKLVREDPLTVDLYEQNGKLCFENLISTGVLKSLVKGEGSE